MYTSMFWNFKIISERKHVGLSLCRCKAMGLQAELQSPERVGATPKRTSVGMGNGGTLGQASVTHWFPALGDAESGSPCPIPCLSWAVGSLSICFQMKGETQSAGSQQALGGIGAATQGRKPSSACHPREVPPALPSPERQ